VWVFWGGFFLDGCTQKTHRFFFGYMPGCLNPERDRLTVLSDTYSIDGIGDQSANNCWKQSWSQSTIKS